MCPIYPTTTSALHNSFQNDIIHMEQQLMRAVICVQSCLHNSNTIDLYTYNFFSLKLPAVVQRISHFNRRNLSQAYPDDQTVPPTYHAQVSSDFKLANQFQRYSFSIINFHCSELQFLPKICFCVYLKVQPYYSVSSLNEVLYLALIPNNFSQKSVYRRSGTPRITVCNAFKNHSMLMKQIFIY